MGTTVDVKLPLLLWRENDQFVAYTPALELSSCGYSEDEAVQSFSEAVALFFETAVERNVVRPLLESLGWEFRADSWKPVSEPLAGQREFITSVPLPADCN